MLERLAIDLIGRPYAPRGRGPRAFDCWGLCLHLWRECYGLDVPDVGVAPQDQRAVRKILASFGGLAAMAIAAPVEGAAVYLTRRRLPDHIGIWLAADRGSILHAWPGAGVIVTRASGLARLGLKSVSYYLPPGFPCRPSKSSTI